MKNLTKSRMKSFVSYGFLLRLDKTQLLSHPPGRPFSHCLDEDPKWYDQLSWPRRNWEYDEPNQLFGICRSLTIGIAFPQYPGISVLITPRQSIPGHLDTTAPYVRLEHIRTIAGLPADAGAIRSFSHNAECTA
jgi:hypothetical protein